MDGRKGISATDETTPLLAASSAAPTTQANEETLVQHVSQPAAEGEEQPIAWAQIFLLCFARLIEPIAFFSIFPFINQMIRETGNLDERDVGFYSGLIESLFSLTQMLLMIQWGRAADRFGRKPVLVFSLVGCSIAVGCFGMAKHVWQMILFRCLAGVFSGTIVTIRTMLSELSTPTTQARVFSFFAFSGNVGIFLGPLIGGSLAEPAKQYSHAFGHVKFFRDYPYALSTIVVGIIGLSSALVVALFVKETLNLKAGGKASKAPMTTMEIIKTPGVPIVLAIYCSVTLVALANTAVAPVFWFTSPALGGCGLSPIQISLFLSVAGLSQSFWTLIVFPPLQHRIGTGGILRATTTIWPCLFALNPGLSELQRHNHATTFWVIGMVSMFFGSGVAQAFTGVQLALNDISPTPAALGTLNAIALTCTSGIRAVIPALFSSLFAAGARSQALDGYLIWVILIVITVATAAQTYYLPAKAEGKIKKRAEEDRTADDE